MDLRRPEIPYLSGVVVAVNALPDVALVVDGPYCVTQKAEAQACHDHLSTLFSPVAEPRVVPTAQDARVEEVTSLLLQREDGVAAVISRAARGPGLGAVLVAEFDYVQLSGFPLEQVVARVAATSPVPIRRLPSQSFDGDWLDGYEAALDALADAVPLRAGRSRPGAVALVGYFYDRAEQDHVGNLRELERLIGDLGASVASTWLGGQPFADLSRVEQAGLIVSLPYARRAAARLGQRLGVPVVEAELPVGLEGTGRFLRTLGQALGTAERAEALVERETTAAVRATERAVLRFVAGNRLSIVQDPNLAAGLTTFAAEVGLWVDDVRLIGKPARAGVDLEASRAVTDTAAPVAPAPNGDVGFEIAPPAFHVARDGRVPVFLGFPNALEHALIERPFLGYQGFRWLVEALANARLRAEYQAECARYGR